MPCDHNMTLKIERAKGESTIFMLRGDIESDHIRELQKLLHLSTNGSVIVFDLKEVMLVDRDVVAFLKQCESNGVILRNCPDYLREWISNNTTD